MGRRASRRPAPIPAPLEALAPELRAMVRELVSLPALWGSAAARPTVERARALLRRTEGGET